MQSKRSPFQQIDTNAPVPHPFMYALITATTATLAVELYDNMGQCYDTVSLTVGDTAKTFFDLCETASVDLDRRCVGALVKASADVFFNTAAEVDEHMMPVRAGDPLVQNIGEDPTVNSLRKFASGTVCAIGRARTS